MRRRAFAILVTLMAATAGVARADEGSSTPTTNDKLEACGARREQAEASYKDGKLAGARDRFEACAGAECPEAVRVSCAQRRAEIEELAPTVAFAVRDSRQMLAVFEGQHGRVVVLTAESAKPPPAVVTEERTSSFWPWIVVGAGGLLVATATVFELVALNENSDRKTLDLTLARADLSAAERSRYAEARDSHHDAAKTNETVAISLGVVGLTAIAAGATWALLRDNRTRSTTALVAPTFGGGSLRLAF